METNGNGNGRIHVSQDRLRAELAEFKNELLEAFDARLEPVRRDVSSLKEWRARLAGGIAVIGMFTGVLAGMVLK